MGANDRQNYASHVKVTSRHADQVGSAAVVQPFGLDKDNDGHAVAEDACNEKAVMHSILWEFKLLLPYIYNF